MVVRVSVNSSGSGLPGRSTLSLTWVLMMPRIFSTAWVRERPFTSWPSIWLMMSLARMPALKAGVSRIGLATLRTPSSIVTSMPRPPNWPRMSVSMSRNDLASR